MELVPELLANEQRTLVMENGNVLHSWVIGLPYFSRVHSTEEAKPKTPVTVQ